MKTEPENGLLWARRFQAHYALGDQKAALADLDSLEKIDGKIKWVQNNRAFLLAEMGEFEKALPDALAAAEKPPDDPGSWDTVGYVYVGLGKGAIKTGRIKALKAEDGAAYQIPEEEIQPPVVTDRRPLIMLLGRTAV